MTRSARQLRDDALAIWRAGVDAVNSERLVQEHLRIAGGQLIVGDDSLPLDEIRRIAVVGAGKAGAGMAAGVESALGDDVAAAKQLSGLVNVPHDCVRPLKYIELHAARPAGLNEPTEAGVAGAHQILRLVKSLGEQDLCLCLISGGGSALLPAPVDGISLADKQAVTAFLSAAGANIHELNTVRKQLSRIKGGGLARACRAGRLIALIISDVIGDPLDVIASGPTVPNQTAAGDALSVLEKFMAEAPTTEPLRRVLEYLENAAKQPDRSEPFRCGVTNLVIGNNAAAVDAAGAEAERRGYSHAMHAARELEGQAEEVGRHLAEMAVRMRDQAGPDCLITGGEPVVKLVAASDRGLGGRNQQLVLAALVHLQSTATDSRPLLDGLALLSGGTDGEDGPTDAAGAVIDADVAREMQRQHLDPADFLRRNDAYHFFDPLGGLIRTGPTHTNVCDLRVVVVERVQSPQDSG